METLREFVSQAKVCVLVKGQADLDNVALATLAKMEDLTVVDLSATPGMSWAYSPAAAAVDTLKAHRAIAQKHLGWSTPDLFVLCETCQQRPTHIKSEHGHFICEVCSRDGLANPPKPRRDVGRNDKCFCGSGKKYKKCCLLKGH